MRTNRPSRVWKKRTTCSVRAATFPPRESVRRRVEACRRRHGARIWQSTRTKEVRAFALTFITNQWTSPKRSGGRTSSATLRQMPGETRRGMMSQPKACCALRTVSTSVPPTRERPSTPRSGRPSGERISTSRRLVGARRPVTSKVCGTNMFSDAPIRSPLRK